MRFSLPLGFFAIAIISTQPPGGTTLTYEFSGDNNGVFYWLGSAGKTTAFANPALNGLVVASQSSLHNSNPDFAAADMCDRANEVSHTAYGENGWFQWDFKDKKLIPTHYTYRGRKDFNGHHPRSWKLQAKVLEADTWTDLDVQVGNNTINLASYYSAPLSTNTAYRFFRFILTAPNSYGELYLTGSSIEFYGEVQEING